MDQPNSEQMLLESLNKGVGVVVALIAALIIAPNATRLLWQTTSTWATTQTVRIQAQVRRVLFRSNRSIVVPVGTAYATAVASGVATMTAHGRVWIPTAPVDERIDALHRHIRDVEDRVGKLSHEVRVGLSDVREAMGSLRQAVDVNYESMANQVKARDNDSARIDARGLPLISIGVVLNGIPEFLAAWPPAGWCVLAGSLAITYRIVFVVVRHHWQVQASQATNSAQS